MLDFSLSQSLKLTSQKLTSQPHDSLPETMAVQPIRLLS